MDEHADEYEMFPKEAALEWLGYLGSSKWLLALNEVSGCASEEREPVFRGGPPVDRYSSRFWR